MEPQSTHRVAIADFRHTSHAYMMENKPWLHGEGGRSARPPPVNLRINITYKVAVERRRHTAAMFIFWFKHNNIVKSFTHHRSFSFDFIFLFSSCCFRYSRSLFCKEIGLTTSGHRICYVAFAFIFAIFWALTKNVYSKSMKS
jgi:hypothetical protein